MRDVDKFPSADASPRNDGDQSRTLLRLYPEAQNYLLKRFATDYATEQFDAAILRYMQPADVTPQ